MRELTPRIETSALDDDASDLRRVLELDEQVTSRVRVRAWLQRGGRSSWPSVAHGDVELAWVERGGILYKVGTKELVVGTGCAIMVPAGTEHASTIVEGTLTKSFWLGRDMVEEISEVIRRGQGADPAILTRADRIGSLAVLMATEARDGQEGRTLAVEALAEAAVVEALRLAPEELWKRGPTDPRIGRAVAMIESCYTDSLTVDDLAAAAGLSRFHFSRLFREQLGVSPYRFLMNQRLDAAAVMLRRGGRSVTEVSFSVGFHELGRFSRLFKNRFGCAPSEVRSRRTIHLL